MVGARITEEELWDLGDEYFEALTPRFVRAVERARDIWLAAIQRRLSTRGDPEPGASPRYRTGELMRSFRGDPVKVSKSGKSVQGPVRSDHPAAGLLEFGGIVVRDGSLGGLTVRQRRERKRELGAGGGQGIARYLPHPYLRPAAEEQRDAILRAMEDF